MNILYTSCVCSEKKFKKLFENNKNMPGQQVQKYHRLLTQGFIQNNCNIFALTLLPISRKISKKIFYSSDREKDGRLNYYYLPIVNIPILKNVVSIIQSFIVALKFMRSNENVIVIGDALNISINAGVLLAAKLTATPSVGIVTDLPRFLLGKSYIKKINNFVISQYDKYVFLTEQMNKAINYKNKPYVIVEGQVDYKMQYTLIDEKQKYKKRICLYSGALEEKYGIAKLVNCFIKADLKNVELHLYGTGKYKEQLLKITKSHKNIKYFGVVLNSEVVKEQMKATLLINPRPSNEEFTKYSFPSKNMEYMASGTPVLTTYLPGMPEEYKKYVYIFDDETENGMTETLKIILSKSQEELEEKGKSAKEFVLKRKNNIIQTRKIIDMFI